MYIDQLIKIPIKKHSFRQNQSESCAFSNEMSRDTLRIVPYFVLSQSGPTFAYRETYVPLLCSCRGGSLSHKTTLVQAHRGFRLLTLESQIA